MIYPLVKPCFEPLFLSMWAQVFSIFIKHFRQQLKFLLALVYSEDFWNLSSEGFHTINIRVRIQALFLWTTCASLTKHNNTLAVFKVFVLFDRFLFKTCLLFCWFVTMFQKWCMLEICLVICADSKSQSGLNSGVFAICFFFLFHRVKVANSRIRRIPSRAKWIIWLDDCHLRKVNSTLTTL